MDDNDRMVPKNIQLNKTCGYFFMRLLNGQFQDISILSYFVDIGCCADVRKYLEFIFNEFLHCFHNKPINGWHVNVSSVYRHEFLSLKSVKFQNPSNGLLKNCAAVEVRGTEYRFEFSPTTERNTGLD